MLCCFGYCNGKDISEKYIVNDTKGNYRDNMNGKSVSSTAFAARVEHQ